MIKLCHIECRALRVKGSVPLWYADNGPVVFVTSYTLCSNTFLKFMTLSSYGAPSISTGFQSRWIIAPFSGEDGLVGIPIAFFYLFPFGQVGHLTRMLSPAHSNSGGCSEKKHASSESAYLNVSPKSNKCYGCESEKFKSKFQQEPRYMSQGYQAAIYTPSLGSHHEPSFFVRVFPVQVPRSGHSCWDGRSLLD